MLLLRPVSLEWVGFEQGGPTTRAAVVACYRRDTKPSCLQEVVSWGTLCISCACAWVKCIRSACTQAHTGTVPLVSLLRSWHLSLIGSEWVHLRHKRAVGWCGTCVTQWCLLFQRVVLIVPGVAGHSCDTLVRGDVTFTEGHSHPI